MSLTVKEVTDPYIQIAFDRDKDGIFEEESVWVKLSDDSIDNLIADLKSLKTK